MKRFQAFGVFLAGSLLMVYAAEEPSKIYECKDAKGNVVYQGEPCDEPAPAVREPPPAAKPAAKATPKAKAGPAAKATVRRAPPVDAKGATPESVLLTFVAAVKAGDRVKALSCLTSSALAQLGPSAVALPMDALQKTVGSFTGYVSEGDVGPFWSIRALRAGTRPKWVFLEKTARGDWKIGAF